MKEIGTAALAATISIKVAFQRVQNLVLILVIALFYQPVTM